MLSRLSINLVDNLLAAPVVLFLWGNTPPPKDVQLVDLLYRLAQRRADRPLLPQLLHCGQRMAEFELWDWQLTPLMRRRRAVELGRRRGDGRCSRRFRRFGRSTAAAAGDRSRSRSRGTGKIRSCDLPPPRGVRMTPEISYCGGYGGGSASCCSCCSCCCSPSIVLP